MIDKNLKVEVEPLKKLPLNVAVYIRVNGENSEYCYSIYSESIEEFIKQKTDWVIAASYVDYDRSGLWLTDTCKLMDMKRDIEDIQKHKKDSNWHIAYDLVVVYNFEQIATSEMEKDFYLDLGFPTLDLEQQMLICVNPEEAREYLISVGKKHEEEYAQLENRSNVKVNESYELLY